MGVFLVSHMDHTLIISLNPDQDAHVRLLFGRNPCHMFIGSIILDSDQFIRMGDTCVEIVVGVARVKHRVAGYRDEPGLPAHLMMATKARWKRTTSPAAGHPVPPRGQALRKKLAPDPVPDVLPAEIFSFHALPLCALAAVIMLKAPCLTDQSRQRKETPLRLPAVRTGEFGPGPRRWKPPA